MLREAILLPGQSGIGVFVPAWRPRVKVNEASRPKFNFYDPGVVRNLAGRIRDPLALSYSFS